MSPLTAFFVTIIIAVLVNVFMRHYLPEVCETCTLRANEDNIRKSMASGPAAPAVPDVTFEDFD